MPKAKTKPTKTVLTATERDAEAVLSSFPRKHAQYSRESYAERDREGGMMDGARMRRDAPIKAMESLMKPNARRSVDLITPIMVEAAWQFCDTINTAYGGKSHELKPFVNKSRSTGGITAKQTEAINYLAHIERKMTPNMWAYATAVFIYHPDKPIYSIFKTEYTRKKARIKLPELFDWIAGEYGLKTRTGNQFI